MSRQTTVVVGYTATYQCERCAQNGTVLTYGEPDQLGLSHTPDTPANDMSVITARSVLLSRWITSGILVSSAPEPQHADGRFPVQREATMRLDHKPLRDQIADASRELKLARFDGSAEWITDAAEKLDELIDQIPRTAQPLGTVP